MTSLKENLLSIMDQKHHWGWDILSGPGVSKVQLLTHFQQEYEIYVRDFPIFLARIYGRMPEGAVNLRREFAENIYEEQTGGLSKKISKGKSHPELFLKMMRGVGYKDSQFDNIERLPTSFAYRSYLDLVSMTYEWPVAAAVFTLFVEGSINDRKLTRSNFKPTETLKDKLQNHSLIKYHGVKESDMDLVKAHYEVEGGHRKSGWETVLKSIPGSLEEKTFDAMKNALELWQLFRDGVCLEMGLENPDFRKLAETPIRL